VENEKAIETRILKYLNSGTIPNVFAFKIQTTGIFDPKTRRFRTIKNPFLWKGTSDVFCVCSGHLIAFEIKRPKPNKTYPNKDQKEFLKQIEKAGGHGFVVRCVEEVKTIMEELCLDLNDDKKTPVKKC